jgi:hypothetical protein
MIAGLPHKPGGTMEKLKISDEDLLKAYNDAIRLELTEDFIYLLEIEIKIRRLVFIDNLTTHLDLVEISI